MRSSNLLACLSGGAVLCALQAAAQLTSPVAVEFLGRDQYIANNPACQGINPSDVAGPYPQTGWNAIDDQYNANFNLTVFDVNVPNVGTTVSLLDTNNNPTGVTLSFNANDSWDNDVNATNISTPNALLMQGIIKSSAGGGVPAVFTFNNVPEGEYDIYVLCDMNGDGTVAKIWDAYNLTTNYIMEQHQFYDTNVFVESTAKSATEATNKVANYVKFTHLGTYGRGQLGINAQWVSGNDGIGIAGLQLVPTGPLVANTDPLSFIVQPISRRGAVGYNNVTFTAVVKGPPSYVQWFKNGTAVPGETNLTYTPTPIAQGDNNATISITLSNNLSSITSSNSILTVGQNIGTNNGTIVMDGGIVNITTQPSSVSLIAGPATTFTVAATSAYVGDASSAAPPITYQWQSAPKNSSSFTSIAGATNVTYGTPPTVLADDGTQFRVAVTAGNTTVNSSIAILSVAPDTTPPVVMSATVFPGGTQVGLKFDENLDPVTAGTAANYKINGVAVSAAIVRTNVANELTQEGNLVSLIAASPINGSFTVDVSGVKDTSGNAMSLTTVPGKVNGMTSTDIGSPAGQPGGPDPRVATIVTNWGDGNFDVLCGGNDYYNNADGISFVWEPKTNSFDVRVRVVSVQGINNWSAGALMVREGPVTTNGGGWELARHYFCKVDYGGPTPTLDASGSGANTYEYNTRLATGDPRLRETSNDGQGGSRGWGGSGPGNPSPVPFPNAWIRIARVKSISNNVTNDHLLGYSSSDGSNWSLRQDVDLMDAGHAGFATISNGPPAGPLPDVMYVGLASTAHNNGDNPDTQAPYQAWIVYRDFGDVPAATTPVSVAVAHNPDGSITITYSGNLYSSTTVNGTFTKVAAATSPYTPNTTGSATMFYRAGP
jgi:hypothetical protein